MAGATVFRSSLRRLEAAALDSLESVDEQLARLLGSLRVPDAELVHAVRAGSRRIAAVRANINRELLQVIASGRPSVAELRVVAAVFDLLACMARMGERCAAAAHITAKLDRLRTDEGLCQTVERIGALTEAQVHGAREAFGARDARLADEVIRRNQRVGILARRAFERATWLGADPRFDDWAIELLRVAGSFEQTADDAVEIAEQALVLVIEPFEEMAYVDQRAG